MTSDGLLQQIRDEQDDLLATLTLAPEADVADRLWARLVDLMVEALFLELRDDHVAGHSDRPAFVAAVDQLAVRCRAVGLLPLPSR